MGVFRPGNILVGLTLVFLTHSASAKSAFNSDSGDLEARKNLADKLAKLSQSLNLREEKFDGGNGGGKLTNANDGNAFASNTTYHSHVWDYCEDWLTPRLCGRWVPRFISRHGKEADRSPLEGLVWDEHVKRAGDGVIPNQGGDVTYSIFKFRTREGRPLTNINGALASEDIVEMSILPDVVKGIQKVANNTANNEIRSLRENTAQTDQDDGSSQGDFVPPEGLRLMARNWTKMLRNRLVSIASEARAFTKGIEFALGEDTPDCESYVAAMKREPDTFRLQERRDPQQPLDVETPVQADERYARCVAMRSIPINVVNPRVQGNQIVAGNPQDEELVSALARVNVALIDQVGANPEEFPLPDGVELKRDQIASEMTDYDENGNPQTVYRTNAEQLALYNKALEEAAQGMKEVTARAAFINDNSSEILRYQIRPRTINAVKLNGLTADQRAQLSMAPNSVIGDAAEETASMEERGPELTFTRR